MLKVTSAATAGLIGTEFIRETTLFCTVGATVTFIVSVQADLFDWPWVGIATNMDKQQSANAARCPE